MTVPEALAAAKHAAQIIRGCETAAADGPLPETASPKGFTAEQSELVGALLLDRCNNPKKH